jgi:hypothetical protein
MSWLFRRAKKELRKSDADATAHSGEKLTLLALEPRVLLDAAAAATAASAHEHAPPPAPPDHSAELMAALAHASEPAPPHAEPAAEPPVDSPPPAAPPIDQASAPDVADPAPPPAPATEIYFIDASVPNAQALAAAMPPGAEVHIVQAGSDGMEQIAHVLAGRSDISAVHILSHGNAGALQLGNATIDAASMQGQHRDELEAIGRSLTADGDILVYGCDFAAGSSGEQAVQLMATLTSADVAASIDKTGAARLGGDWTLEYATASIEGTQLSAPDWDHTLVAPVVDLNSNATPTQIVANGGFSGSGVSPTNWTGTGGGAVNTNQFTAYQWTPPSTTATTVHAGTLTQTGVTGWGSGAAPSGAAVLTFRLAWGNNTGPPEQLDVSIGGVLYARFTGSDIDANGTVTFFNGATGTPSTIAAGSAGTWTGPTVTIDLPANVAPTGDLVFSHTLPGGATRDGMRIDSVSVLSTSPAVAPDATPGVGFSTTYTENGAPVSIADTDATVRDQDSTTIQSATVVLTNAQAGDVLTASTLPTGISAVVDTSVAGRITLTLSGSSSHADYSSAIRGVTFRSTSDAPSTVGRIVQVSANDGTASSAVATTTIAVSAVNDAPVNSMPPDWPNALDRPRTLTGLSVADADAAGATAFSVRLSVNVGTVSAAAGSGVTISNNNSASVLLTGAIADINALLASGITYTPASQFIGTATLTMLSNDAGNTGSGGALSDSDSAPINVVYATSYTENTAAISMAAADTIVLDRDSVNMQSATIVLTNAQAGDVLALGPLAAGITGAVDTSVAGQITITLSGSASNATYAAAIRGLTFSNTSEAPSTVNRIVNMTVNDGTASSAVAVTTIMVVPVNDAPVLTDTVLTMAQVEDAAAATGAVGTLVSTFTGGISDVDASALQGIAVVAADTANGSWFYSIDSSANWLALGPVSGTSARLLDPNARLYFQPNANFNGTVTAGLTIRAWDQTSGSNGGTADASANGGTTAFSAATDTVLVSVAPVNDAPVLDPTPALGLTVNEDAGLPVGAVGSLISDFTAGSSDVDAGAVKGIAVVSTTETEGIWYYTTDNGATWATIGAASNDNALLLADIRRLGAAHCRCAQSATGRHRRQRQRAARRQRHRQRADQRQRFEW